MGRLAQVCNSRSINLTTPIGALPYESNGIVDIPHGTHCLYKFSVPYGYALQLRTIYNLVDPKSALVLTNSLGKDFTYNKFGDTVREEYWCTAGNCQMEIQSVSGISFITNYWYESLNYHTAINKLSGDYFQLSQIIPNQFLKYYGSKVALTLEKNTRPEDEINLKNYYVYNGSSIVQSAMMGTSEELRKGTMYLGYNFVSIVNFYDGIDSNAFIIANDQENVSLNYTFILTSMDQMTSQKFSDFSENGGAVTFACSDCSQFYLTQLVFDPFSSGYVTFQGQSPSQSYLSKILNYTSSTFTQNQLPQLIPTNKFTMNLYKCSYTIQLYGGNEFRNWTAPYFGRSGLIASPTVWDNLLENGSFVYEFRDDSQLFNFSINMTDVSFNGDPTDSIAVMIGVGPGFNNLINLTYPGSPDGIVSSIGNYMYIASKFSMFTKFTLPFEISGPPTTSTETVFTTTSATSSRPTSDSSPTSSMSSISTSIGTPATASTFSTSSSVFSSTTIPTTTNGAFSSSLALSWLIFLVVIFSV